MEISETKDKKNKQNKELNVNKEIKQNKVNEQINKFEINDKRINECILEISPFEKLDRNILNVSKSICKIKIEIKKNDGIEKIIGTGFLLKFNIYQEMFYCLMTNEHIIRKDIINNNNIIILSYDNEFKTIKIELNNKERYIKTFK